LREAESGETVVEICRKHGISQQTFYLWKKKYAGLELERAAVAHQSGVHEVHISDLERGTREVRFRTLYAIAKALGVSLAQIVEGIEQVSS
jgi:transcriptional regulator with XRE-family HTH domain